MSRPRACSSAPVALLIAFVCAAAALVAAQAGASPLAAWPLLVAGFGAAAWRLRSAAGVDAAAVADVGGPPLMDPQPLRTLAETLGDETRDEVVEAFLAGCEEFEQALDRCVTEGDAVGLGHHMHRLAGSTASVGALALAGRARAAERLLAHAQVIDAALLARLELPALRGLLQDTRALLADTAHAAAEVAAG